MSEGNGLPPGWIKTTLGQVFKWGSGGTPQSTNDAFYNGGIPWLVIGDLSDGVVSKSQKTISEAGLKNSSAKWVQPGSVLMAMYGSIGKLGIASGELTTNQAIAFTDPDPVENKYLFYYLLHCRRELAELGKGGTQQNISQTVIKAFPFILAPLAEQRRIVAAIEEQFARLDAGVATLERARANLKRYRASVLKAAVEGRLTEGWREANPDAESGSTLLERILEERRARWEEDQLARYAAKEQDPPRNWRSKYKEPAAPDTVGLPRLPDGWCWSSLGQCFEVGVGATPSRSQPDYWNGNIPWVSSGEVQFCRIKDTKEKISESGLVNSSTQINPAGSVLLGMIGEGKTRGQVAIQEIEACNNQNCAAIWVSETPLTPSFVYHWLWSRYEITRRGSSGNNQPALNKSRVQQMPMPLPSLAEQEEIVAEVERRLSVIEEVEAQVEAGLKRAARLRQSILKRAFEGRLVPQDPTDEPASVLLERIREEREQSAVKKLGRKRPKGEQGGLF